ncbi:MAG TPA: hopanoid-associated sugar epimerase, partial [Thermoanaerobaculia bacterium]|nr:hopanoid-associated sugar epimerase [Thermoanaerobaculia bacterium]
MNAPDLVTGGTGFVGAHVVRALLARGRAVRCLVRPGRALGTLGSLPVEIARGDLRDPASLARAAAGIDTLYHCAADYRLWSRDPRELYAANVDGTENALRAAAEAGARRIVHTSSVATLAVRDDGHPATESDAASEDAVIGHYKRSKVRAEKIALRHAAEGAPVVVVNPSTPVGELDAKPTPTGRIIVDFLAGRMPAYVDTGLNLVDVRDVAAGHLLAAERGRPGERYILGNRDMTLKEIFDVLARISGVPAPKVRLPHWIPIAAAAVDT